MKGFELEGKRLVGSKKPERKHLTDDGEAV